MRIAVVVVAVLLVASLAVAQESVLGEAARSPHILILASAGDAGYCTVSSDLVEAEAERVLWRDGVRAKPLPRNFVSPWRPDSIPSWSKRIATPARSGRSFPYFSITCRSARSGRESYVLQVLSEFMDTLRRVEQDQRFHRSNCASSRRRVSSLTSRRT